jgi:Mrp family chromosome partitioning ATPase
MSRNFELLKQIELEPELNLAGGIGRAATARAVVREVLPVDIGGVFGDEMLRLVQGVFLSANGSAPRQVVFCGVDGDNGSSSVCASAGCTLAAKSSLSVCLVDANVSWSRLSGIFGIDTTIPFSSKSASLRDQCIHIHGNLWLAGTDLLTDDRGALLPVEEIKLFLAKLCDVFEFVLIDAPGVSVSGDGAILGQVAGAAVLVIEANSTRRLTARKAKETLDAAGVRILGTVLRNRSFPIPKGLYKRL